MRNPVARYCYKFNKPKVEKGNKAYSRTNKHKVLEGDSSSAEEEFEQDEGQWNRFSDYLLDIDNSTPGDWFY